ncbi:hypothetical protein [Pseudobacteriovorax antillogorgiicola]|uniref:Beta-barrel porin 2 n=1 Tax=Pseudobacteriovorax antillogorgiicola TaxID=1513793 RepID=A0A1Y6CD20_9BACT|nr:hypothetical protein [Pseudobacteriovorax antillogorgiicola]TCS48268.1 hypothetical protein EDD56_11848 [Pseudobacteriovorax antillogorgiicola]SMF57107.1 hypothetical protein SAMN06296036_11893 [Pseudobacteriovorax antillogorgiicola]
MYKTLSATLLSSVAFTAQAHDLRPFSQQYVSPAQSYRILSNLALQSVYSDASLGGEERRVSQYGTKTEAYGQYRVKNTYFSIDAVDDGSESRFERISQYRFSGQFAVNLDSVVFGLKVSQHQRDRVSYFPDLKLSTNLDGEIVNIDASREEETQSASSYTAGILYYQPDFEVGLAHKAKVELGDIEEASKTSLHTRTSLSSKFDFGAVFDYYDNLGLDNNDLQDSFAMTLIGDYRIEQTHGFELGMRYQSESHKDSSVMTNDTAQRYSFFLASHHLLRRYMTVGLVASFHRAFDTSNNVAYRELEAGARLNIRI